MRNETYLHVDSVLGVLRTGDIPIKVTAVDGNVYLIKHDIKGHAKRNLVCEYLAHKIFDYFGVSIPNAEILTFDPNMFAEELSSVAGRFVEHKVFASKWLNALDIKDDLYVNHKSADNLDNPTELAKILVMDLWLKNSDRQPLNLNLIVSKQRVYAIDHSAIFDQNSFRSLVNKDIKEYFTEPGEQGDLLINSHYFKHYFKKNPEEFHSAGVELCDKINSTDLTFINNTLDSLPEGWHITKDEKSAILDYLDHRKNRLYEVFTGHLDFSRK